MRPQDWKLARQVLEEVLELPAAERDARLVEAARDQPALLAELRVLAAEEPADDFLVPPRAGTAQAAAIEVQSAQYVGQRLGAWRIEELIAVGGMGAVFSAARVDAGFEQRAAIKVLAAGLGDVEAVRRFHRERQVLARLEHPSVTRLLDGGTTEDGRPFLVMEWVDGAPITHDAGAGRLPVAEALRRVVEVGEAVAYAHRNLVIHRDLKPGNLLLTAEGRVKLLDFGISSLLDEPRGGGLAATTMSSAMTWRYSSPEQIRGRPITTATDVYSLGVVLYELLTGRTPVDAGPDLMTALDQICGGDFPPPSAHRPELGSELDAIAATALAEDPARRYPSVEALADDLRRHLAGELVHAHPPTTLYRFKKLVRRNRAAVGVAAAVITMLALLAAVLFAANARLARERTSAVAARQVAERLNDVLLGLFEGADPVRLEGGALTVLDLLEDAAAQLDTLTDTPAAEAALRLTIGRAYLDLSLAADADPQLRRAVELLRELPREQRTLAEALEALAQVKEWRMDLVGAEAALRECVEVLARGDADPPALARVQSRLAERSAGSAPPAEVEARTEEALRLARRLQAEHALTAAEALERIASLRIVQGQVDDGLALSEEALSLRRARFADDPRALAAGLEARASALLAAGELEACEAALRAAIELHDGPHGAPQPASIDARIALAFCAMQSGRMDEALERFEQVASLTAATLPSWHAKTAFAQGRYGDLLASVGRFEEAEPLLIASWRAQNRLAGEGNAISVQLRERIAGLYDAWGRADEAARWRAREPAPE